MERNLEADLDSLMDMIGYHDFEVTLYEDGGEIYFKGNDGKDVIPPISGDQIIETIAFLMGAEVGET